jgi:hypothetical protein
LPGATDPAWDVAALIVEAGLWRSGRDWPISIHRRESGDSTIEHRLPFYLAAYAAFRLRYCRLAQPSVGDDERARFVRAERRYASVLRSIAQDASNGARPARTQCRREALR